MLWLDTRLFSFVDISLFPRRLKLPVVRYGSFFQAEGMGRGVLRLFGSIRGVLHMLGLNGAWIGGLIGIRQKDNWLIRPS